MLEDLLATRCRSASACCRLPSLFALPLAEQRPLPRSPRRLIPWILSTEGPRFVREDSEAIKYSPALINCSPGSFWRKHGRGRKK